ncbi:extracellular solute-binding protein [Clostridium sp. C2-6-12]|uniref:ABC transporter substrate-binding protein n=1 Tax=Clostridium sp. C2-6-12 TaxID=2698832 RepID=UPI001FABAFBB|nr:extracellular solute-binding protein [Clostridium sp. C2-6-12]
MIAFLYFIIFSGYSKSTLYTSDKENDDIEGNITFISNRTDKRKELDSLIGNFQKIHPKAKINLELIGDSEEILRRKAAVGELPDVTLVPTAINFSEINNYFLPLDDLGFNKDKIYNYNLGLDGKAYSLTASITWQGVIYNKKIFKQANIKELPKTEEEFFDACDKIKNIGVIPIAINYREKWSMNMWADSIPYLFNPDLEKSFVVKSKDIFSEESSFYKSLEFARKIVQNGYCENDFLNYDWQQCKSDMKNGKIGMIILNSDFIYQLEDMGMPEEDISIFPIPGSKVVTVDGDNKFAISKNTKYPKLSKEFLKYMFEEDRYSKAVNVLSALKNSKDNIKMIKNLEQFNLPIILQEEVSKSQTIKDSEIHDKYYDFRKINGLDGNFTQKYVIASDVKPIQYQINQKWKEYMSKIRN